MPNPPECKTVIVLGAGPAGLTAAWDLARNQIPVIVLDQAPDVGGLGGTTIFQGRHGEYRFDYGGHRFITHDPDLLHLAEDLLGDDLLTAQRKSVIRLRGRTYHYPLESLDLLRHAPWSMIFGVMRDILTLAPQPAKDFATWTRGHFGPTLYETFFRDYTAKLWGIPPDQLSADWADQRISLLDLKDVIRRLLPMARNNPRTYARSYRYPKWGFGQLFQKLAHRVQALGGQIRCGHTVTGFTIQNGRIRAVQTNHGSIPAQTVISTLPLPHMVQMTGGQSGLRFRGLRFFNLPMECPNISDCTWQYLSDSHLLATRLQEPRRRSPFMAPAGQTSLMLEIPCDPGDALWEMPDHQLYPRALADLRSLGIDPTLSTGEYVSQRSAFAYPLLDVAYAAEREKAIHHLNGIDNLIQCGRQGTFRYIFTDTAMETGKMASRCVLTGDMNRRRLYDHRNERIVIETQSIA